MNTVEMLIHAKNGGFFRAGDGVIYSEKDGIRAWNSSRHCWENMADINVKVFLALEWHSSEHIEKITHSELELLLGMTIGEIVSGKKDEQPDYPLTPKLNRMEDEVTFGKDRSHSVRNVVIFASIDGNYTTELGYQNTNKVWKVWLPEEKEWVTLEEYQNRSKQHDWHFDGWCEQPEGVN